MGWFTKIKDFFADSKLAGWAGAIANALVQLITGIGNFIRVGNKQTQQQKVAEKFNEIMKELEQIPRGQPNQPEPPKQLNSDNAIMTTNARKGPSSDDDTLGGRPRAPDTDTLGADSDYRPGAGPGG